LFGKKEPVEFTAKGIEIQGPICNRKDFWEGKAQLNTAAMTFLNLDFLNREVQTLTCDHCGYVLWFDGTLDKP
jgi:predicted nucleic-acid-binding Zn-ribbon protein